jgi:hypothetical protein
MPLGIARIVIYGLVGAVERPGVGYEDVVGQKLGGEGNPSTSPKFFLDKKSWFDPVRILDDADRSGVETGEAQKTETSTQQKGLRHKSTVAGNKKLSGWSRPPNNPFPHLPHIPCPHSPHRPTHSLKEEYRPGQYWSSPLAPHPIPAYHSGSSSALAARPM